MKRDFNFATLAAAALLMSTPALPARADLTPNFGAAPYVLDQTVLGIDGWNDRLTSKPDNPDRARLVALRWNGDKPTLVLRSASIKNTFPATTGERVHISFQLALSFPDNGRLREFRMIFNGAPIGEIYFDHTSGLGHHGLGNTKEGTLILAKPEIAVNSFYRYDITLDFKKQTYDIEVTGKKKDDSPFQYKAQNIEFVQKDKVKGTMDSIAILNSARVPAYLTDLKIESK